jgi:tripartite ATP-independent transporter DctM subunit
MSAAADAAAAGPTQKQKRMGLGAASALVLVSAWLGGPIAAVVVLFAVLGAPLFAILGGTSELLWLNHPREQLRHLHLMAPEVLSSHFAGSPIITTIPLFTFTGYLMAESKTPERLVRTATAWVGWIPGGLAIVCVVASAVFTLFTGGSGVTIIAVGGLLYPALRKEGYSEKFSLGLVTTGGSVGLLLPYSLPLLVFALVSGLDFNLAFKAVLAPGLLVVLMLAAYSAYIGITEKVPRVKFDPKEAGLALWDFKWELGIPIILVVGLKTGLAQIDECAGLVALYTLLVEVYVYKDLNLKRDIVRIAKTSMALAGAVILILAMANALISYVIQESIPQKVLEFMLSIGLDKSWQFLIVMNIFLLVLGMVMDGFSAILVAVPLVLPFAAHFGLGPFHMAIMFVLNLELAFCCPPLGLNIFISSFRFNRPVVSLYKVVLPFAGILAVSLLLVTYIPKISNVLVIDDIAKKRQDAIDHKQPPREAWLLECVQADRANPLPCSPEDKKAYPNGQLAVAPVATQQEIKPMNDAGAGESEDDDLAAIMGTSREGGAPDGGKGTTAESEEDDLKFILGGAGGEGGAPAPKQTAPQKEETDEDILKEITGGKDGG